MFGNTGDTKLSLVQTDRKQIFLEDYLPPNYQSEKVDLDFQLFEDKTIVTSTVLYKFSSGAPGELTLLGEELKIISIKVSGVELTSDQYIQTESQLKLNGLPDKFILEIQTEIYPQNNTLLEGLYKSGNIFCTQNEPEGFRRITYFLDRPDNMGIYTTRIEAEAEKYPILLSNGNRIDSGLLDNGRHWVLWEDPFKKPSYLYALVAGDLAVIKDTFTTMSGRIIALEIYTDKGSEDKCDFAMASLKNSMKWDEDTYGLEYDLDIYMIVAVESFNMGAMENKGLNVFNSHYVLADSKTATDHDYSGVEGVIGHEYFHNWTGNRVTCRDWFQLTLKEGLTVFRDQRFSADMMMSETVKRIQDVESLRLHQFAEDAGPNSHPIRPESYIEINNFYTATIYQKGSEIIRMIETLIGREMFRKGMDKYFELYDGQAVTTDDFIHAMAEASGFNFTQFKLWYSNAGTPEIKIVKKMNTEKNMLEYHFLQHCPDTPGQANKPALHIPLNIAFVKEDYVTTDEQLFQLTKKEQVLSVSPTLNGAIPSFNRMFSAPVKILYDYSNEELAFIMAHDSDGFNRWEASQKICFNMTKDFLGKDQAEWKVDATYLSAIETILSQGLNKKADLLLIETLLTMPTERYLNDSLSVPQYKKIHDISTFLHTELGKHFESQYMSLYETHNDSGPFVYSSLAVGQRGLKNRSLEYLTATRAGKDLAWNQLQSATNMTEQYLALRLLAMDSDGYRDQALDLFKDQWKGESLVMDKLLYVVGLLDNEAVFSEIEKFENSDLFNIQIPNKVRALYRSLYYNNVRMFHDVSGSGYHFLGERIKRIDPINPRMASSLATAFKEYARIEGAGVNILKTVLEDILDQNGLSNDTYEIVSKTLKVRE